MIQIESEEKIITALRWHERE